MGRESASSLSLFFISVIVTESVSQTERKNMTYTSHKSPNSNYFFTQPTGTDLVKGSRGDTCRQCLLLIRSFAMKPFTDHFSFARKTISLFLLVAFVMTNIGAIQIMAANASHTAPFASYTTDLTQLGREGRLRQSLNFESEVNQVLEVLEKGGARQPVLVDENGSVQDEIVEQIAIRISNGSVSKSLKDRAI